MSVFMMFGLLIPILFGVFFISVVVALLRRTTSYHENGRMDMNQLQTDMAEIKKDLQEIKEQLADVTIQLDETRFRS